MGNIVLTSTDSGQEFSAVMMLTFLVPTSSPTGGGGGLEDATVNIPKSKHFGWMEINVRCGVCGRIMAGVEGCHGCVRSSDKVGRFNGRRGSPDYPAACRTGWRGGSTRRDSEEQQQPTSTGGGSL